MPAAASPADRAAGCGELQLVVTDCQPVSTPELTSFMPLTDQPAQVLSSEVWITATGRGVAAAQTSV